MTAAFRTYREDQPLRIKDSSVRPAQQREHWKALVAQQPQEQVPQASRVAVSLRQEQRAFQASAREPQVQASWLSERG